MSNLPSICIRQVTFNSKSSVISAALFQALIVLIRSCQYTVAQLCITKMDIYLDIFITMYRRVELCKKKTIFTMNRIKFDYKVLVFFFFFLKKMHKIYILYA